MERGQTLFIHKVLVWLAYQGKGNQTPHCFNETNKCVNPVIYTFPFVLTFYL